MAYARTGVSSSGLYFHCSHKFLQVKIFHISLYFFFPQKKNHGSVLPGTEYCCVFLMYLLSEHISSLYHLPAQQHLQQLSLHLAECAKCRLWQVSHQLIPYGPEFCVCVEVVSGFYSNKFIHLPVFLPRFMTLPQRLNIIHLMFLELCPFIFLEQSHFENLSGFLQLLVKNLGGHFFLPRGFHRGFKLYEGLTCIEQTVPPLSTRFHFTKATSVAHFRATPTSELCRADIEFSSYAHQILLQENFQMRSPGLVYLINILSPVFL